jgi:hypothetical protein
MRDKLPNRRMSVVKEVYYNGVKYLVTFGIWRMRIKEVFCASSMCGPLVGSEAHALVTDACILLSLHLQTGATLEKLSKSLGQDRTEGAKNGPPSSIVGVIVSEALNVEEEFLR